MAVVATIMDMQSLVLVDVMDLLVLVLYFGPKNRKSTN
jgi:hypothetical protein